MPTVVNVVMNSSDAKMVEKLGAATIVANKATWPATVQSIDRHPEDENVENQGRARREEIRVETVRDGFGVSTSKKPSLSMRLCSRFEGAFAHVVMTPLTPAWNC